MQFVVTLEQDETGMWVVECPAIPGCISQCRTPDEAAENIQDAIRACLEVRRELGMPLTIETRTVDVAAGDAAVACRERQRGRTCFRSPRHAAQPHSGSGANGRAVRRGAGSVSRAPAAPHRRAVR